MEYHSTDAVAKRLHTSTTHVRRMIAAGLLRAVRVGKRTWRISQADLDAFLSSRGSQPPTGGTKG